MHIEAVPFIGFARQIHITRASAGIERVIDHVHHSLIWRSTCIKRDLIPAKRVGRFCDWTLRPIDNESVVDGSCPHREVRYNFGVGDFDWCFKACTSNCDLGCFCFRQQWSRNAQNQQKSEQYCDCYSRVGPPARCPQDLSLPNYIPNQGRKNTDHR